MNSDHTLFYMLVLNVPLHSLSLFVIFIILSHLAVITFVSYFRWGVINQPNITHNHIIFQMRCNQPNITHIYICILKYKIYEQWSHFILDAHFIQNTRFKRTLPLSFPFCYFYYIFGLNTFSLFCNPLKHKKIHCNHEKQTNHVASLVVHLGLAGLTPDNTLLLIIIASTFCYLFMRYALNIKGQLHA